MSLKKMVDQMFREIREAVLTGGKKKTCQKCRTKKNRKSVNLFEVMDEVDSLDARLTKISSKILKESKK